MAETPEQRKARMHELAERSARIRRERKAQGLDPSGRDRQTRIAPPSAQLVSDSDASDLASLQRVIDHAEHDSDRIRAIEAKQRILQRVAAVEAEAAHGDLLALRSLVDTVPPHERGALLAGLLRLTPVGAYPHSDAAMSHDSAPGAQQLDTA